MVVIAQISLHILKNKITIIGYSKPNYNNIMAMPIKEVNDKYVGQKESQTEEVKKMNDKQ